MRRAQLAVVTAALSIALACLGCEGDTSVVVEEPAGPYHQVRGDLAEDRAILVDVREMGEWDRGHLDGAIIFPLGWLRDYEPGTKPNTLPVDKIIYVYGGSVEVAEQAAGLLTGMGFDARALDRGLDELAASFELVRPER